MESDTLTFDMVPDFDECRLGVSSELFRFSGSAENLSLVRAMSQQAQRSLAIYTRELERRLYDDAGFLGALRRSVQAHPQWRLRILIQDSQRAIKYGHRLIELSRQLSTQIEVRRPHSDYRTYNASFLVADAIGIIQRPLADRFEGTAAFHAPNRARELLELFDAVWARSEPEPEFRRLHI